MRLRAAFCLSLAAVAVPGSSGVYAAPAEKVAAGEPEPAGIFGGQVAMMCAWPAAVAVTSTAGTLCTGSLVHPRVVMFAAHCGGEKKSILFGQKTNAPFKTIQTDLCMANPSYGGVNDQAHDWAFCRLATEITEIPVTPVVYGCEMGMVQPGAEVAITGFGKTVEDTNDAGIKNWGMTPIHDVFGGQANVGGLGDPGICPGDSGGPALIQYPDGTWHVFGIASTLTGECGGEGTHALAWDAVPWIEEQSGIDITPCHDVDGTWRPSNRCKGFYAGQAGVGHGDFLSWCEGTPAGPSSASCGAAFDSIPDDTPPTVTITTPTSASYPDMTSFTTAIEVTADDGDGWGVVEVRVKINGKEQPLTDNTEPYGFDMVKFPSGVFEIVAVAEDAAGQIGESEPVVIEVGMTAPETSTGGETGETGETGAEEGGTPTTGGTPTEGAATFPTLPITATEPLMDGDDSGCGCRSQPPAISALWLLALLGVRRRRVLLTSGSRSG
jgi:hypothetical protein